MSKKVQKKTGTVLRKSDSKPIKKYMNKFLCELRIDDVRYSKQHPMIYYHLWEIDKNGELIHKSKIEFADNVNDLIKESPYYKNAYKNG